MTDTHKCPPDSYGMMPMVINEYASKGNTDEVMKWLENGGDINASNLQNNTLVFIATCNNNVSLLKKLLMHPEVHVNQRSKHAMNNYVTDYNTLEIALLKGHVESIDLLLSTPSKCKVDLNGRKLSLMTQLRGVINRKQWLIIRKLVNAGMILEKLQATQIICAAAKDGDMETVKALIDRKLHDVTSKMTAQTLEEIYMQGQWDYVGGTEVFEEAIKKNSYFCLGVLHLALKRQDFKVAETLMKILIPNVTINISLSEALLEKDLSGVEKLLSDENIYDEALSGAILVGASEGTSDAIVHKLMSFKDSYPCEVLNYALLLASVNDRKEWVCTLMKKQSFSYSVLCYASNVCKTMQNGSLFRKALQKVTKETLGLDKKCSITDDEDDDEDDDYVPHTLPPYSILIE